MLTFFPADQASNNHRVRSSGQGDAGYYSSFTCQWCMRLKNWAELNDIQKYEAIALFAIAIDDFTSRRYFDCLVFCTQCHTRGYEYEKIATALNRVCRECLESWQYQRRHSFTIEDVKMIPWRKQYYWSQMLSLSTNDIEKRMC